MFEAFVNINEILLSSTRSREFVVGSKLTPVSLILVFYDFPERVCPMLLVTKASVTMPCETHVLGKLKVSMAVYILAAKGTESILCFPVILPTFNTQTAKYLKIWESFSNYAIPYL